MSKTKKATSKKSTKVVTSKEVIKANQALCIRTEDLEKFKQDMTSVEFHLVDRHDVKDENGVVTKIGCENDINYLQLIPYVMVVKTIGNTPLFLTYARDTKSTETRLVNKRSLGFGGHIDTQPSTPFSISRHIFEEAARELKEELNFDVSVEKLISTYSNPNNKTPISYIEPDLNSENVSQVHLGILITIVVGENDLDDVKLDEGKEVGHIAQLKWSTLGELKERTVFQRNVKAEYLKEIYEEWSVKVINMITVSQPQ